MRRDRSTDAPRRGADRGAIALLAAIAYLPLLATAPGRVGADTKTYLYLDPGRLLSDATSMWDPGIGTGTVTHQNIGYLWPMGPYYWLLETAGLPDWVAQRLWTGSLLFLAGLGVRWLLGVVDWRGAGVGVAALAYMLSPYVLDYEARISVILLPWVGLPWLIGLTAKSLRHGGWRHPALFALVALTIGGVNATALIMVAPGPLLWILHAVVAEREVSARDALGAVARIGVLTLATSLWWIAGLWAQGRYGLPVIRFTESYRTVAESSTAPEVLRGLGYWFFYGRDKLGPWIEPSVEYTNRSTLLALSYVLPVVALGAAAAVRWRHRSFFVACIAVGGLMAVGAHPWDGPSPLGAAFKAFTRTDAGLALRSTPRAVPLVVLGTSVLLGTAVAAFAARVPRRARHGAALVSVLIVANLPTLWVGQFVAENLERPEEIPTYWRDAAAFLDDRGDDTRVLEIPGADFASYRWGNTVDPITPGLMDRPYVARELFAYGSPASIELLMALDHRFHTDTLEPAALAPIARLLGVGDIALRADLQYERYRTARPRPFWQFLHDAVGEGDIEEFGPGKPNIAGPEHPMIDEIELATDPALPWPPEVAVIEVTDPVAIVRATSAAAPLVVDGAPEGLVDAAGAGLLDPDHVVLLAAPFEDHPDELRRFAGDDAHLVVTDSNRKRGRRWGTIRENTGRTERAGETPVTFDPTDNRVELFPGASEATMTLSEQVGDATVWATGYGNEVTYTPDDRPENAFDGDPLTAWRVGAIDDPTGEKLVLDLKTPVTTDRVRLLQPTFGITSRSLTEVRVRFDDDDPIDVVLGAASFQSPGQEVRFPRRTFRRLSIEVRNTDAGTRRRYDGLSGVGFAEIGITGDDGAPLVTEERIRPPRNLLGIFGAASATHPLTYLFSRQRSNPAEPVRTDEEVRLVRIVDLPTDRALSVSGTARLSSYISDTRIDELIGAADARKGGVTASSTLRLPGDLRARAAMAIDGDLTTAWQPPFQTPRPDHLEFWLSERVSIDTLDLDVVTDGRHSTPKRIRLFVDDIEIPSVEPRPIPAPADLATPNATTRVRLRFPRVEGARFRLRFEELHERETTDWYSGGDVQLPIGIAEVHLPGTRYTAPTGEFDTGCRDDLVRVDDTSIPVRVHGTIDDALDRKGLQVDQCGGPVELSHGAHVLRTAIGRDLGIDIDWLRLDSPIAPAATESDPAPATHDAPEIVVQPSGKTALTASVRDADAPYWLVLGQSHSDGWSASLDGRDLGPPTLVDGFANGWRLDPKVVGDDVDVRFEWRPQRIVRLSLGLSAIAVVACICLVLRRPPRATGTRRASTAAHPDLPLLRHWEMTDPPLPPRVVAVTVAGAAVFAFANVPFPHPAFALVPVVVLLAARLRRGAWVQGGVAAACLAAAGAGILVQQYRMRFAPDFRWPLEFEQFHVLGVACLVLCGTGAIWDVLTRRADTGTPPAGTPEPSGAPGAFDPGN